MAADSTSALMRNPAYLKMPPRPIAPEALRGSVLRSKPTERGTREHAEEEKREKKEGPTAPPQNYPQLPPMIQSAHGEVSCEATAAQVPPAAELAGGAAVKRIARIA